MRAVICVSILGCCSATGCGSSPPTRYYILDSVPSSRVAAITPNQPMLRVEPVAIPGELDRTELVTKNSPNSVSIDGLDRWAAPLDEQIRRVLSADLVARLPPNWVADPLEPMPDAPRRRLFIQIESFYADSHCAVSLKAAWTLRDAHGATRQGSEEISAPPQQGPCAGTAAAKSMSNALGLFADRLAPAMLLP